MVDDRLASIQSSLELLERWRDESGGGEYVDGLNQSSIELEGRVRDFALSDLQGFAEAGNRARLEIIRGAWTARLAFQPDGRLLIDEVIGPFDEAFPDQDIISEAQAARDEGRAADLLQLSAELDCMLHLSLENRAEDTGFHWVRTGVSLLAHLSQYSWLGFVRALFATGTPCRLVVHDSGESSIAAGDLVVHGPNAFPPDPPGESSAYWRDYSETWLQDGRAPLPPPVAVHPSEVDDLDWLAERLARIAHGLSWLWLATTVQVEGARIALRFEGAPDLDFDLTEPPDPAFASDAVRLWKWAVSTADPARREALQQSVSLVVREPDALERSPERVLRTAKYLLRLAQQGAVAEALAVRRTTRQAAISAAQGAAEASRAASRSVVDRVLAQLIGAFGVLLASRADVINPTVAEWLLVGLLGLALVTGIVAFVVEFPAARGALDAFEVDLDGYSDTLVREDIDHIKSMRSLSESRAQLTRAQRVSGLLVVAAATAVIVARLIV